MVRSFKLKIELVPENAWRKSLYRTLKRKDWLKIKDILFSKEGKKCWICKDKKKTLEAHETWRYDYKKKKQILKEVHHLCHTCHQLKHIGFWGVDEYMIKHFCKVNKCKKEDFDRHKKNAWKLWNKRNGVKWKQDFSLLSSFNKKI